MRARDARRAGGPAHQGDPRCRGRARQVRRVRRSSSRIYLALVGDSADGYPGISGIGPKGAARLLNRYGPIEDFPPEVLGERRALALLFKRLATLRTDAALFADVETLRWRGPRADFPGWAKRLGNERILERATRAAGVLA